MEKASISDLKNHLSEYLQKVRAGETVLVLDRNRPVARIERVGPDSPHDDRARRLERAGIVRRGARRMPLAKLREPAPAASRSVVQALIDERAEGR